MVPSCHQYAAHGTQADLVVVVFECLAHSAHYVADFPSFWGLVSHGLPNLVGKNRRIQHLF